MSEEVYGTEYQMNTVSIMTPITKHVVEYVVLSDVELALTIEAPEDGYLDRYGNVLMGVVHFQEFLAALTNGHDLLVKERFLEELRTIGVGYSTTNGLTSYINMEE